MVKKKMFCDKRKLLSFDQIWEIYMWNAWITKKTKQMYVNTFFTLATTALKCQISINIA